MDIDSETRDGTATLRVTGDMDVETAYRVYEAVAAVFEEVPPPTQVVIDLSQVPFMDSVGLGMLVRSEDEARRHRATLVVHAPSDPVRRLLSITAMTQILSVTD